MVGSGSTYTRSICPGYGSFNVELTVNGTLTANRYVTVEYEVCECCNTGQICN